MKALLALLLSSALCFAEPVVHAEPAKSGSPAGGAGERSEPEGVPRAEPAVSAEPPASRAAEPRTANPARSGGRRAQRPPLRAEVSLVDGSILKGALRQHAIPACSPALGRVRIDLAKVERIDFIPPDSPAGSSAGGARSGRREGAGGAAEPGRGATSQSRIAFRNGDRLTVHFPDDLRFLPFDTLLGRVRLPLRAVSSISFNPSTPSTPSTASTASTLLYHCTFDSPESISRPAAGPAGTFLGGEFVPGKVGKALLVKAGTHAAEVPFPTGLMQPQGCIEFWGKVPGAMKETRYPDGGNPQFFAMGVGKYVNTFVKYTSNDGMGSGGLHANLPGSAYVSTLPSWSGSARYPEFLGDPSAWHHYALVWSEEGLDAASEALGRRVVSALYVDGRLVNPAYGTNGPDRAKFLREFVDNPVVLDFPLVSGRQPEWQNRVDYLIDDFKIWSIPKFDSAGATVVPGRQYKPELLYHCTFDSAEAIEHPAAGPNGTFLGGEFVPGKKGNALRTFADEPAAEVDFDPGFLGARGTIEFWAKMEEATKETVFGDGGNPRFFCLWIADDINRSGLNPRSSYLQWSGNDGGGRSGLCAMIQRTTATSEAGFGMRKYPSFLGDPAAWHHYAVVWDENGVDGSDAVLSIYVDGTCIPTGGYNELFRGKGFRRFLESAVLLGFPQRKVDKEPAARHVSFLIDEFKIWSAPKTEFGKR